MAKPAKPIVPPPPLRSNPETFSARMEASLLFWKTFADYLDALGDHAEAQADAALAAALAAGAGTGLALKGNGGKVMAVNAGATALEFLTASGAGKAILANASAAGLALASGADAAAQRATLGLGAVTSLAEAVTDLNAITVSGWARFAPGTANAPVAENSGYVLTILSGSVGVQMVWGHLGSADNTFSWMRWRASNGWRPWVRLYGSDSEIRTGVLNASGDAPTYACRAWVNFNGTTGAIRAAGNVSSITKNGTGDYTVNFATAMPDANYAVVSSNPMATDGTKGGVGLRGGFNSAPDLKTTTQVRIVTGPSTTLALVDFQQVDIAIFR